jgi:hypothetical protein
MVQTSTVATTEVPAPPSPSAPRVPRRRWRDWRLVVGVVLVLGSVLVGVRVVSAADDTVPVWSAGVDLLAGSPLQPLDLEAVPVRIEADANPYLTGSVPEGYVLTRDVSAGELVPEGAVAAAAQASGTTRNVAVSVEAQSLPGRLSVGDRVDVWVVPDQLAEPDSPASLLVAGVPVSSASSEDSGFGSTTARQSVVVSLDAVDAAGRESDLDDVIARLVAASAAGRVVLTLDPTPR